MISQKVQIDIAIEPLRDEVLQKGCWLAILHASRIPPHVGIIFNGNYSSLTIKEREMDIATGLLLKTIRQKNIPSVFLKIAEHPVYSISHLKEMFLEHLLKYEYVKQFENSCLSPVKAFFNEFYALDSPKDELFFDFAKRLYENAFLLSAASVNLEFENGLELPYYSLEELNEKIRSERKIFYKD